MENENLKLLLKDAEDRAEERRLLDLKVAEERAEKLLKAAEEHAEKLLKAAEDRLKGSEERAERHLQSTLGIIYTCSFLPLSLTPLSSAKMAEVQSVQR
jgi:cytochrome P450